MSEKHEFDGLCNLPSCGVRHGTCFARRANGYCGLPASDPIHSQGAVPETAELVATLEQELDAQSFPERFAIWKALGFPEGHQGDLVAAVTAVVAERAAAHEAGFAEAREAAAQKAEDILYGSPAAITAHAIRSLSAPTKEQQGGEK